MRDLSYERFREIDFSDPFFDTLKEDYRQFSAWCELKAQADESAYVFRQGGIKGFLYLKPEVGAVADVEPNLAPGLHLKVGTFKFDAHGTRLGQRFVKKIFDVAIALGADDSYVTVYPKHERLISILRDYGFSDWGIKGEEIVLRKSFNEASGDILLDYPRVSRKSINIGLLAIYPEYHTNFLPDSKLRNESINIVEDVSHANSIHKIYISGVAATGKLSRGDILVLYRTTDIPGRAYYRSVATSVGVVEEVRRIASFQTEAEFLRYVKPYSVFSRPELKNFYASRRRHIVIKFTYNIALPKRVNRKSLLEEVGLPGGGRRWDYLPLTRGQFNKIIELGQVNESYFVD